MISAKYQYIAGVVLIITAFALGRYSNTLKPSTSNIETNKVTDNKDENKQTHTVTTVVTTKEPDGSTKTTETDDTTISDKIQDKSQDTKVDQTVVTQPTSKKLNISALVSPGLESGIRMAYGASISKEVLGPITVGAFGLTNGVLGLSIGLDF
jgi:hypothetical protein